MQVDLICQLKEIWDSQVLDSFLSLLCHRIDICRVYFQVDLFSLTRTLLTLIFKNLFDFFLKFEKSGFSFFD